MLKYLKTWIIDNILVILPDKIYLQIKYLKVMHRTLHLKNPRSFNEKIQWLKEDCYRICLSLSLLYQHHPSIRDRA